MAVAEKDDIVIGDEVYGNVVSENYWLPKSLPFTDVKVA